MQRKRNYLKKTKTGCTLNRNGGLIKNETPYRPGITKIGRYRPTIHNISDI